MRSAEPAAVFYTCYSTSHEGHHQGLQTNHDLLKYHVRINSNSDQSTLPRYFFLFISHRHQLFSVLNELISGLGTGAEINSALERYPFAGCGAPRFEARRNIINSPSAPLSCHKYNGDDCVCILSSWPLHISPAPILRA
jgi:hypothetical protein